MAIMGVGMITLTDLNDAIISGSPPSNPTVGTLWIDSSSNPPKLKRWSGTAWIEQNLDVGALDPALGETIENVTRTIGNMANDNLIDFQERQIVKDKLAEIIGYVIADTTTSLPTNATLMSSAKGGFWRIRQSALNAGIPTNNSLYVAVATRYDSLKSYLDGLTPIKPWDLRDANKDTTISVTKSTFRDRWLQYYLAVDALATYTSQVLKEYVEEVVENIEIGGTNFASNGDFSIPLSEAPWKDNYVGNTVQIVDISTETPPFELALRVNNTSNINGGIFSPIIFNGNVAEAMVNKEITISFWLKYQNILQGTNVHNLGRFGELIVEGETATGTKVYSYIRVTTSNTSGSSYFSGTNMTWRLYHATHKLVLPTNAVRLTRVSFKHGLEGCRGEFWTTGVQIEQGNKRTAWSPSPFDLQGRIEKALFEVQDDRIVAKVTSSQTWIDQTSAIGSAQSTANNAKSTADDIMSDMKVTPPEKQDLNRLWQRIQQEYSQLNSQASSLSVSSTIRTNYTNAYNALNGTAPRIQTDILTSLTTTYTFTSTSARDTFRTQLNTYFTRAEEISKAITDVVNGKIDGLKVGGRNIILNSSYEKGENYWTGISSFSIGYKGSIGASISRQDYTGTARLFLSQTYSDGDTRLESEKTYTFSGWFYIDSEIDFDSTNSSIVVRKYQTGDGGTYSDFINIPVRLTDYEYNKWHYFEMTRSVPSGYTGREQVSFGLGKNGSVTISRWKLEEGNKATDWTSAPEDISENISELFVKTETNESSIDQVANEINLRVRTDEYEEAIDGISIRLESTESAVIQNSEQIEFSFNEITSSMNQYGENIDEINAHFRFNQNGMNIGRSDSPLNITISNEQIDFVDNGNVVAYVNGQKMYITDIEVLESLIVGVHKIEKYNTEITLIKWVGEE
ncbi:hypothetical protein PQE75_gp215 [Bacillus phage vB_BcoS-136]|uniref:Uncharacterized protein n=1 Tax=Bacillus phage vB_BcoS-136 TaxID=2419619 RepID=A0A3G3BVK8_9CAUD|nr:hypothetical protein PQE75_gp215 [Bacillus phage vB_BcoS-136]AYP68264.1 hypothetical protein vBBcoS136_00149 [Bacillus phage vB_BcoS-136]